MRLRTTPLLIGSIEWELLRANHQRFMADPDLDPVPVVHLLQPEAAGAWLLASLAPDADQLFGLCDPGLGTPELGFVSLAGLHALGRHDERLRVERDRYFEPDRPLSAYAAAARAAGRITL